MPLNDTGIIIKVVLIVILIILMVVEFFTLFAGVVQMSINNDNPSLMYDGICLSVFTTAVLSLSFFGLFGAIREHYLKLFVFAGILSTVLLISLMAHLFFLPSKNTETDGEDLSRETEVTESGPIETQGVFERMTEKAPDVAQNSLIPTIPVLNQIPIIPVLSTLPSAVPTLPPALANLPSVISTLPSVLSNLPAAVPPALSKLPSVLQNLPAALPTMPPVLANLPSVISTLPSVLSNLPAAVPPALSKLPSVLQNLPAALPTMPPFLASLPSVISTLPSVLMNLPAAVPALPSVLGLKRKPQNAFRDMHPPNIDIFSYSRDEWDIIQYRFRCCGTEGPNSWIESNMSIPFSCCHPKDNSLDPVLELCRKSGRGSYVRMRGCMTIQNLFLKRDTSGKKREPKNTESEVTLGTLMRIFGYSLQLAAIVLSIWLANMILQYRREECYYFCGK